MAEPMWDRVMEQILSILSRDSRFDAITRRGDAVCMERAGVCRVWVRRRALGADLMALTVEGDRWLGMFGSWQRGERAACPPFHRRTLAGVPWATGVALDMAERLMAAHNARLLGDAAVALTSSHASAGTGAGWHRIPVEAWERAERRRQL